MILNERLFNEKDGSTLDVRIRILSDNLFFWFLYSRKYIAIQDLKHISKNNKNSEYNQCNDA